MMDTWETEYSYDDAISIIDWRKRYRFWFRTIAFVLIFAFILYDISWAQGGQPVWENAKPADVKLSGKIQPEHLNLPKSLGSTQAAYSNGGDDVIINIQDAHASLSAQESITQLLDTLANNYDLNVIALEGASGALDVSLLRSLPDKNVRKDASEYLMRKGRMSAGEFFTVTSEKEVKLYGIEDNSLYQANVEALRSIARTQGPCVKNTEALITALKALEPKIYSKDLQELNAKCELHRAKSISFSEYWDFISKFAKRRNIEFASLENLSKLIKTIALEKKIDFNKANDERKSLIDELAKILPKNELEKLILQSLAFKKGTLSKSEFHNYIVNLAKDAKLPPEPYPNLINFTNYSTLYEDIDIVGLFGEVDSLEDSLREKIYRNEDERNLQNLISAVETLKKLFEVALTNGDFERFTAKKRYFDRSLIADFIRENYAKYGLVFDQPYDLDVIFGNMDEAVEFYNIAQKRNNAMLANTIEAMKKNGEHIAALITGGYHSKGLSDLMKEKGLSYLVIMPKFEGNESRPYIAILTNKTQTYEELLESGEYTLAVEAYFQSGDVKTLMGVPATYTVAAEADKNVPIKPFLKSWLESFTRRFYTWKGERRPVTPEQFAAYLGFNPPNVTLNSNGEIESIEITEQTGKDVGFSAESLQLGKEKVVVVKHTSDDGTGKVTVTEAALLKGEDGKFRGVTGQERQAINAIRAKSNRQDAKKVIREVKQIIGEDVIATLKADNKLRNDIVVLTIQAIGVRDITDPDKLIEYFVGKARASGLDIKKSAVDKDEAFKAQIISEIRSALPKEPAPQAAPSAPALIAPTPALSKKVAETPSPAETKPAEEIKSEPLARSVRVNSTLLLKITSLLLAMSSGCSQQFKTTGNMSWPDMAVLFGGIAAVIAVLWMMTTAWWNNMLERIANLSQQPRSPLGARLTAKPWEAEGAPPIEEPSVQVQTVAQQMNAVEATGICNTLQRFDVICSFSLNPTLDLNDPKNAEFRMGLEGFRGIFGLSDQKIPFAFEHQYRTQEDVVRLETEPLFQADRKSFHLKTLIAPDGRRYELNLVKPETIVLMADRNSLLYEIIRRTRPSYISTHLSASVEERSYGTPGEPYEAPVNNNPILSYDAVLDRFVENINTLQANLSAMGYNAPILVEPLDYHDTGAYEHVTDPKLINAVLERTKAHLLIDCSHLLISAKNRNMQDPDYDFMDYVREIVNEDTVGLIDEVHLNVPDYNMRRANGELLDMHMPFCTDSEAARDIRKILRHIFELRLKKGITKPLLINFESDFAETDVKNSVREIRALAGYLEEEFRAKTFFDKILRLNKMILDLLRDPRGRIFFGIGIIALSTILGYLFSMHGAAGMDAMTGALVQPETHASIAGPAMDIHFLPTGFNTIAMLIGMLFFGFASVIVSHGEGGDEFNAAVRRVAKDTAQHMNDTFNIEELDGRTLIATRQREGVDERVKGIMESGGYRFVDRIDRDVTDFRHERIPISIYVFARSHRRRKETQAMNTVSLLSMEHNYRADASVPNHIACGVVARVIKKKIPIDPSIKIPEEEITSRVETAHKKVQDSAISMGKNRYLIDRAVGMVDMIVRAVGTTYTLQHLAGTVQAQIEANDIEAARLRGQIGRDITELNELHNQAAEQGIPRKKRIEIERENARVEEDRIFNENLLEGCEMANDALRRFWFYLANPYGNYEQSVLDVSSAADIAKPGEGRGPSQTPLILCLESIDPLSLDYLIENYNIQGIVAMEGTLTSHWVIHAQSRGIPITMLAFPQDATSKPDFYRTLGAVIDSASSIPADRLKATQCLAIMSADNVGNSEVIFTPTWLTVQVFKKLLARNLALDRFIEKNIHGPLESVPFQPSGVPIRLEVSADNIEDVIYAMEHYGAAGVGLFRTEYLFTDKNIFDPDNPDIKTNRQVRSYLDALFNPKASDMAKKLRRGTLKDSLTKYFKKLIKATKGYPVRIRTLDLEPDKRTVIHDMIEAKQRQGDERVKELLHVPGLNDEDIKWGVDFYRTPLGGEMLAVELESMMEAHLECIDEDGVSGMEIMFPMVSTIEDVDDIIRGRTSSLSMALQIVPVAIIERRGKPKQGGEEWVAEVINGIPIGIVVERPEAVDNMDQLARVKEIDFFEIGSNDLSQLVMSEELGRSVSRDKARDARILFSLQTAVLMRMVRVMQAVQAANREMRERYGNAFTPKYLGICGELGGLYQVQVALPRKFERHSMTREDMPFGLTMTGSKIKPTAAFIQHITAEDYGHTRTFLSEESDSEGNVPANYAASKIVDRIFNNRIYLSEGVGEHGTPFRSVLEETERGIAEKTDAELAEPPAAEAALAIFEKIDRTQGKLLIGQLPKPQPARKNVEQEVEVWTPPEGMAEIDYRLTDDDRIVLEVMAPQGIHNYPQFLIGTARSYNFDPQGKWEMNEDDMLAYITTQLVVLESISATGEKRQINREIRDVFDIASVASDLKQGAKMIISIKGPNADRLLNKLLSFREGERYEYVPILRLVQVEHPKTAAGGQQGAAPATLGIVKKMLDKYGERFLGAKLGWLYNRFTAPWPEEILKVGLPLTLLSLTGSSWLFGVSGAVLGTIFFILHILNKQGPPESAQRLIPRLYATWKSLSWMETAKLLIAPLIVTLAGFYFMNADPETALDNSISAHLFLNVGVTIANFFYRAYQVAFKGEIETHPLLGPATISGGSGPAAKILLAAAGLGLLATQMGANQTDAQPDSIKFLIITVAFITLVIAVHLAGQFIFYITACRKMHKICTLHEFKMMRAIDRHDFDTLVRLNDMRAIEFLEAMIPDKYDSSSSDNSLQKIAQTIQDLGADKKKVADVLIKCLDVAHGYDSHFNGLTDVAARTGDSRLIIPLTKFVSRAYTADIMIKLIATIRSLGATYDQMVDAWLAALKHSKLKARMRAFEELSGLNYARAIGPIVNSVSRTENIDEWKTALGSLNKLGAGKPEIAEFCLRSAACKDTSICEEAKAQIRRIGIDRQELFDVALKTLNCDDSRIRLASIEELSSLGDVRAAAHLARAAEAGADKALHPTGWPIEENVSAEKALCNRAIEEAAKLNDKSIIPALIKISENENIAFAHVAAIKALSDLGYESAAAQYALIEKLLSKLADKGMPTDYAKKKAIPVVLRASGDISRFGLVIDMAIRLVDSGIPCCDVMEVGTPIAVEYASGNKEKFMTAMLMLEAGVRSWYEIAKDVSWVTPKEGYGQYRSFIREIIGPIMRKSQTLEEVQAKLRPVMNKIIRKNIFEQVADIRSVGGGEQCEIIGYYDGSKIGETLVLDDAVKLANANKDDAKRPVSRGGTSGRGGSGPVAKILLAAAGLGLLATQMGAGFASGQFDLGGALPALKSAAILAGFGAFMMAKATLPPRGSKISKLIEILLKSKISNDRASAIEDLAEIISKKRYTPADAEAIVRALIGVLNDPDQYIRNHALLALAILGPAGTPAVPNLIGLLKDKDREIRSLAASALGHIGPTAATAVPALIVALTDEAISFDIGAFAISSIGGPEATQIITDLCRVLTNKDADIYSRTHAAEALGLIGSDSQEAIEALTEVSLENEKHPLNILQRAVVASLAKIGGKNPDSLPALIDALNNKDKTVQETAVTALGAMGAASVRALRDILKSKEHWPIYHLVIRVLGLIGPAAKDAIPELLGALDNEWFYRAALDAIKKIDPAVLRLKRAKLLIERRQIQDDVTTALRGVAEDAYRRYQKMPDEALWAPGARLQEIARNADKADNDGTGLGLAVLMARQKQVQEELLRTKWPTSGSRGGSGLGNITKLIIFAVAILIPSVAMAGDGQNLQLETGSGLLEALQSWPLDAAYNHTAALLGTIPSVVGGWRAAIGASGALSIIQYAAMLAGFGFAMAHSRKDKRRASNAPQAKPQSAKPKERKYLRLLGDFGRKRARIAQLADSVPQVPVRVLTDGAIDAVLSTQLQGAVTARISRLQEMAAVGYAPSVAGQAQEPIQTIYIEPSPRAEGEIELTRDRNLLILHLPLKDLTMIPQVLDNLIRRMEDYLRSPDCGVTDLIPVAHQDGQDFKKISSHLSRLVRGARKEGRRVEVIEETGTYALVEEDHALFVSFRQTPEFKALGVKVEKLRDLLMNERFRNVWSVFFNWICESQEDYLETISEAIGAGRVQAVRALKKGDIFSEAFNTWAAIMQVVPIFEGVHGDSQLEAMREHYIDMVSRYRPVNSDTIAEREAEIIRSAYYGTRQLFLRNLRIEKRLAEMPLNPDIAKRVFPIGATHISRIGRSSLVHVVDQIQNPDGSTSSVRELYPLIPSVDTNHRGQLMNCIYDWLESRFPQGLSDPGLSSFLNASDLAMEPEMADRCRRFADNIIFARYLRSWIELITGRELDDVGFARIAERVLRVTANMDDASLRQFIIDLSNDTPDEVKEILMRLAQEGMASQALTPEDAVLLTNQRPSVEGPISTQNWIGKITPLILAALVLPFAMSCSWPNAHFSLGGILETLQSWRPAWTQAWDGAGAAIGASGALPIIKYIAMFAGLGLAMAKFGDWPWSGELSGDNPEKIARAYNKRGVSHAVKYELQQALECFTKAIEIYPEYADAFCGRATVYMDMGQPAEALRDFTAAARVDGQSSLAYYGKGMAECCLNLPDEAMADFNKALEIAPNSPIAYYGRGTAYALRSSLRGSTSVSDVTAAIDDFKTAAMLDPTLIPDIREKAQLFNLPSFDFLPPSGFTASIIPVALMPFAMNNSTLEQAAGSSIGLYALGAVLGIAASLILLGSFIYYVYKELWGAPEEANGISAVSGEVSLREEAMRYYLEGSESFEGGIYREPTGYGDTVESINLVAYVSAMRSFDKAAGIYKNTLVEYDVVMVGAVDALHQMRLIMRDIRKSLKKHGKFEDYSDMWKLTYDRIIFAFKMAQAVERGDIVDNKTGPTSKFSRAAKSLAVLAVYIAAIAILGDRYVEIDKAAELDPSWSNFLAVLGVKTFVGAVAFGGGSFIEQTLRGETVRTINWKKMATWTGIGAVLLGVAAYGIWYPQLMKITGDPIGRTLIDLICFAPFLILAQEISKALLMERDNAKSFIDKLRQNNRWEGAKTVFSALGFPSKMALLNLFWFFPLLWCGWACMPDKIVLIDTMAALIWAGAYVPLSESKSKDKSYGLVVTLPIALALSLLTSIIFVTVISIARVGPSEFLRDYIHNAAGYFAVKNETIAAISTIGTYVGIGVFAMAKYKKHKKLGERAGSPYSYQAEPPQESSAAMPAPEEKNEINWEAEVRAALKRIFAEYPDYLGKEIPVKWLDKQFAEHMKGVHGYRTIKVVARAYTQKILGNGCSFALDENKPNNPGTFFIDPAKFYESIDRAVRLTPELPEGAESVYNKPPSKILIGVPGVMSRAGKSEINKALALAGSKISEDVEIIYFEDKGERENLEYVSREARKTGAAIGIPVRSGVSANDIASEFQGGLLEEVSRSLFDLLNPDLAALDQSRAMLENMPDAERAHIIDRLANVMPRVSAEGLTSLSLYSMNMRMSSIHNSYAVSHKKQAVIAGLSNDDDLKIAVIHSAAEIKLLAEAHRGRKGSLKIALVPTEEEKARGLDIATILKMEEVDDVLNPEDVMVADETTTLSQIKTELRKSFRQEKGHAPKRIAIADRVAPSREKDSVPKDIIFMEYEQVAGMHVYYALCEAIAKPEEPNHITIERSAKGWFKVKKIDRIDYEQLRNEIEAYEKVLMAA